MDFLLILSHPSPTLMASGVHLGLPQIWNIFIFTGMPQGTFFSQAWALGEQEPPLGPQETINTVSVFF